LGESGAKGSPFVLARMRLAVAPPVTPKGESAAPTDRLADNSS